MILQLCTRFLHNKGFLVMEFEFLQGIQPKSKFQMETNLEKGGKSNMAQHFLIGKLLWGIFER